MNDYDYIKNFSKITVNKICRELKIDRGNVIRNTTSEENLHKIRKRIESELANLYKEE